MPRKKQKDITDLVDDLINGASMGNGHDIEGLIDAEESGDVDDLIDQTEARRAARGSKAARAIKIPVATGENNYTRFEFRELVERGAARYLMPDVCRANGFSETLRIGRHAAAHQIAVAPHVVHELSLQVVGALPNGFLVEFIDWTPPDLFEEMPECRDGCFRVPERPGHGMALARGAKEKYRSA